MVQRGSDASPFSSTTNNKAQAGNSHINDGGPLSAGLRKTDEQNRRRPSVCLPHRGRPFNIRLASVGPLCLCLLGIYIYIYI